MLSSDSDTAIKERKAELRLERVDRVADGGRRAPKTFGGSAEAPLLDHGQQHQELVHTRGSGGLHFESPEKNFQIYSGFPTPEAHLCTVLVRNQCSPRRNDADSGIDRREHPASPVRRHTSAMAGRGRISTVGPAAVGSRPARLCTAVLQ